MQNPAKSLIFVRGAQVCRRGMASVGVGVRQYVKGGEDWGGCTKVQHGSGRVQKGYGRGTRQGRKGVMQAAKSG